jgi:lysyl-tRNA synthetase class 2
MLEKVQEDRLRKFQQIQEMGIDPYGWRYDTAEPVAAILGRFEDHKEGQQADAAGRIILMRDMGKMIFATIRDGADKIQICLRKDQPEKPPRGLDENQYKLAKLLDLGDIVAARGALMRTRTGEITIFADKLTLLSKSLLPMPEKWHGLTDRETRYRQRYLDLMTNPESLVTFQKRIAIIETIRGLLHGRGFVEVETPVLQPIYGGAAARPFTTHHNALDCLLYMRISPELYLKRLLVGGMNRVFEFSRNFRNEGIDTRHNPEFTLLELYQAYADYEVMMEITEELVCGAAERVRQMLREQSERRIGEALDPGVLAVRLQDAIRRDPSLAPALEPLMRQARDLWEREGAKEDRLQAALRDGGRIALPYGERTIDYTRPWPRMTYGELMLQHAGVDMWDAAAVRAKARSLGIEEGNKDDAVVVNEVFEAVVEPALAAGDRPVFVKDYPAALCPLTRRDPADGRIALRFECFIAGMEIANAYSELNDPAVQEANFRQQLRGEAEGETMRVMDEDFVTALRHGMPPAGGLGVGIDRVVMLLTNTQSIRDVVLFPMLRPEQSP